MGMTASFGYGMQRVWVWVCVWVWVWQQAIRYGNGYRSGRHECVSGRYGYGNAADVYRVGDMVWQKARRARC